MKNQYLVLLAAINGTILFLASQPGRNDVRHSGFFVALAIFSVVAWGIYLAKTILHLKRTTARSICIAFSLYILSSLSLFFETPITGHELLDVAIQGVVWFLGVRFLWETEPHRKLFLAIVLPSVLLLLRPLLYWPVILILHELFGYRPW